MELKEAIEKLKVLSNQAHMKSYVCVDGTYANTGIGKTEKEAIDTVLQSLEEYKEAYSDYQELGKEYAKLQDENEKLREIDFTTLYMMGVSDGKTKLENKIKEKIEELKTVTETCYGRIKYQEGKIAGLEEQLKGE